MSRPMVSVDARPAIRRAWTLTGGKVHLGRPTPLAGFTWSGSDRTLCGRLVAGIQPGDSRAGVCLTCWEIAGTEAPSLDTERVPS